MRRCAICKKELHGIAKKWRKLPASKKRVERKFGGYLCSNCTRKILSEEVFKAGVAKSG